LQQLGITTRAGIARICPFVLLALSSLGGAYGQSTYGAIIGTVKDTSGAVIGNASIKITNTDENTTHQVQSQSNGDYELLNILIDNSSVGQITSVRPADFGGNRTGQVGARVEF
jgi:hypothetical protein